MASERLPHEDPLTPSHGCWMPLTQAAKALGVSPTTVRRRIASGDLAAQRQPFRQNFRWLVLVPTEGDQEDEGAGQVVPIAPRGATVRDAIAEVRETEESLRELAARVDFARREIIDFVEHERTSALRHADRFEDAAREAERAERAAPHLRVIEQGEDAPCPEDAAVPAPEHAAGTSESDATSAAEPAESGSMVALLLSCAVLIAMVAVSFVALPAWTNGIIASVAAVAGLIAVVEAFLVVSRWVGTRQRRSLR